MRHAVAGEAAARLGATLAGIQAYRAHPYRRAPDDMPVVWRQGAARLLDYAPPDHDGAAPAGCGVLFVPSLINRAHILDLRPGASMLKYLARHGVRPLLLDWGEPGTAERGFNLEDYIAGPLHDALTAANDAAGGPVGLAGYCMGGTLAVAAARLWPELVASLTLLAAPWDFHATGGLSPPDQAGLDWLMAAPGRSGGVLPVDLLQSVFLSLDPTLSLRKFSTFSTLDPASRKAADFVAVEDWLNDGVPLAGPAAIDCFKTWYAENAPARLAWRVLGRTIDPGRLTLPTLAVVAQRDRIVPAASSMALARAIPGARLLTIPSGHIGMITGGQAKAAVWRPLARWLSAGEHDQPGS